MDYELLLDHTERILLTLRSYYLEQGYSRYRMETFEEYDLYRQHKDFLISDQIISFTDLDGTLMALTPDVTLSVIRHTPLSSDSLQKLFYSETVYRGLPGSTHFQGIPQTGLECLGRIDTDCIGEVLMLAAKSLSACQRPFILTISHLALLSAALRQITEEDAILTALLKCTREKNCHGIDEICRSHQIPCQYAKPLQELIATFGPPSVVLPRLAPLAKHLGAYDSLLELQESIHAGFGKDSAREQFFLSRLQIDFSVTGDTNYYNGVLFKGFLEGIPESVLSGGRYDHLVQKLGRTEGAIGFALYLNKLKGETCTP